MHPSPKTRPQPLLSVLLMILALLCHGAQAEEDSQELPDPETFAADMTALPGYFDLYWSEDSGEIYVHVQAFDQPFLYITSLAAGVGSNDIGLDRGQLGSTRIVHWQRAGSRVMLVEPNQMFRATHGSDMEQRAVNEAFAQSILASFEIVAVDGDSGGVLIKATPWFTSDVHQVAITLADADQGSFKHDPDRSFIYPPRTRAFPDNTEVEAVVTFSGSEPGDWVSSVTPTPEALSVRMHHSLVRLPDDGFEPRRYDPRTGYFPMGWRDYSVPLHEPIEQRVIWRHRLQKKDPTAAVSDPVEPIVYYLDPGTPEPIRSALLEGASWWADAFEAAGFSNAYRVEMLPPDVDPMDVRYNVIQWVHRSTRGWSYGFSVIDPRTGEIIKGHITLGSLRVRQDQLIAESLTAPFADPDLQRSEPAEQLALARLRQLSAHEVGHTLGLAHNFAPSAYGRESVMDYPHPLIVLDDEGRLSLSQAYDHGIGEWDKLAIRWGYAQWPDAQSTEQGLAEVVQTMRDKGYSYISDPNARGPRAMHPTAHLWDNGMDAAAELDRVMGVRAIGLQNFSPAVLRGGTPMIEMETALVPLYLMHRYQTEAAAHVVAGRDFRHALRGDGDFAVTPVRADQQRAALDAILRTLDIDALSLDESILSLLPPAPIGFGRHREHFSHATAPAFDALAPVRAASDLSVSLLLHPARAARLHEQAARDSGQLSLQAVIGALVEAGFPARAPSGMDGAVQRTVGWSVLVGVQSLALNRDQPQVRAIARGALSELAERLRRQRARGVQGDFNDLVRSEITQLLEAPDRYQRLEPSTLPPGSPIGMHPEE